MRGLSELQTNSGLLYRWVNMGEILTIVGFTFVLHEAASTVALKQTGNKRWCIESSTQLVCEYTNINKCEQNISSVDSGYQCTLNPRLQNN